MSVCAIAEWVEDSVDPDQTPRSAASDLNPHCLFRPVFPNTRSKYGNLIKSTSSEIILDQPLKHSWINGRRRSFCSLNKPHHDKTNKMDVRPAKTQISLGVSPVWSESSLCAQWIAKNPSFLHIDSEEWADLADAEADLSLRWAHMPFCWFCHEVAQI